MLVRIIIPMNVELIHHSGNAFYLQLSHQTYTAMTTLRKQILVCPCLREVYNYGTGVRSSLYIKGCYTSQKVSLFLMKVGESLS